MHRLDLELKERRKIIIVKKYIERGPLVAESNFPQFLKIENEKGKEQILYPDHFPPGGWRDLCNGFEEGLVITLKIKEEVQSVTF